MTSLQEGNANVSGDIEFRWGRKGRVGRSNPGIQYYESFSYDDVEYFIYDSVYLWCEGQSAPHIGKIIEIFETPRLKKMVKVVWYLRPGEVRSLISGTHLLEKELFLASGEGEGLYNFNPLETISGKCNVVCISEDKRNPKASMEEIKMSDYVFYRTFDVGKCTLLVQFPDKIAGVEVGHYFNPKPKENTRVTGKPNSHSKFEIDNTSTRVKDKDLVSGKYTDETETIKRPKRKLQDFKVDEKKTIEAENQNIMLVKRPKVDTSEWFKKLPWEERMREAHAVGSLVLLENLYPSFTSSEVEDIVFDAFNRKVSAKMIQWNAFSSPHNGQALVIFNTKNEADLVISELKTRCLMIGGVRPIVGSRPELKEPGNRQTRFFGHIINDSMKLRQRIEMKNAVSTCHYAQPNTIAFDMAIEWQALQKKSVLWWDALYEQQAKELANLKAQLKSPPSTKK